MSVNETPTSVDRPAYTRGRSVVASIKFDCVLPSIICKRLFKCHASVRFTYHITLAIKQVKLQAIDSQVMSSLPGWRQSSKLAVSKMAPCEHVIWSVEAKNWSAARPWCLAVIAVSALVTFALALLLLLDFCFGGIKMEALKSVKWGPLQTEWF